MKDNSIRRKHSHSDRDKIYTPEDIAKRLIAKIPVDIENDTMGDPCKGSGAFFNNFPVCADHKVYWELDEGKDFLKDGFKVDWQVTNIPFSMPKEFIFAMAENCNKGFGILCLSNSMTVTRLKKLETMGLYVNSITSVYIKEWGFGYKTDFYVFTKERNKFFEAIIHEKQNESLIKEVRT